MRNINIRPALNGFIAQVGCQEIVFTNVGVMCSEIQRYVANPLEVEKEYRKNAVNKECGPISTNCDIGASAERPHQPHNYPSGLTSSGA